jgi:hypothetical protein
VEVVLVMTDDVPLLPLPYFDLFLSGGDHEVVETLLMMTYLLDETILC